MTKTEEKAEKFMQEIEKKHDLEERWEENKTYQPNYTYFYFRKSMVDKLTALIKYVVEVSTPSEGMFSRNELIRLRNRAEDLVKDVNSTCWRRAYERLADAVDHLDAMLARSEDFEASNTPADMSAKDGSQS